MMIALLEDDSWQFEAELSLKRSGYIRMYRKRTEFVHLKRKSQCGEKKEKGNTTLPSKEKEHIIVTGQFRICLVFKWRSGMCNISTDP